jgi:protein SCO1/2
MSCCFECRNRELFPMIITRKINFARALAVLSILSTAQPACHSRATGPEQRYAIKGKVVSVERRDSTVTISHEAIPGYMDAMTMPFKLKDERLLADLAEGDRVQGTLVVKGLQSWLEDVVAIREAVDQSDIGKSQNSIEPKPGDEVPDFTLVNQDGKPVKLTQYRGRVLVLTFVYTRCPLPDYCPLMTDNFSEIEKTLKAVPEMYAKSHLLSISVDPDNDTPKVLRAYATNHSADFGHWDFLTGARDDVKRVATYFGMQYWRDGDQVVHSLRTAIVGADGKVVKLYRGNEWKPEEIVSELRELGQVADRSKDFGHGVGIVESFDQERATIQINHEDIKDLMPAMNMPFAVKDKALLDSVNPGDKIDFWVEPTPAGLVVVRILKR